jgi:hypothetical protein
VVLATHVFSLITGIGMSSWAGTVSSDNHGITTTDLTHCGLKPRASDIMRFIVISCLRSGGREVRDSIPIRVLHFIAVAVGTMKQWKE